MKKIILLTLLIFAFGGMQAQWVDNPTSNTFIANCEDGAGELRVATSPDGGTFVQWTSMSSNGWSQKLQYLDYEGNPQWGDDGIAITTPNLATWSPGYALAALTDGSVVTMNRNADAHHYVVKINPDGSTPWGTDGMILFNGEGGGRSELLAGDDGGFWALGTDMDISYLQYVNADGTLRPMATIFDFSKKSTNGKLIPADDGVFVVYAKQTLQGYTNYNKEIYAAKYNKDGELVIPATLVMGLQTVNSSYIHYAIADGMGGAYVFQYHRAIGNVFNVYVTHFDENCTLTIADPNGVTVHSTDYDNFYISAYPTVDPVNHDLLLVYRQTDAYSQSQYKILINRITATGEKPWGEGILVLDNGTTQCGGLRIDAFKYHEGFSVIYHKAVSGAYAETIEAHGFDRDGNVIWNTTMCQSSYPKTGDENTSGYNDAQNIIVWVNSQDGGLYGQNIGEEGEMGEITIPEPPPVPCCFAPDNFDGNFVYNEETASYGAMLTWEAPAFNVLHYNLYRQQLDDGTTEIIGVDADATSYFDELTPGSYNYQLTAVYPEMESEFALTVYGDDYLIIEIPNYESVSAIESEEIMEIIEIYNINGQRINSNDINALSQGVYIMKGVSMAGKTSFKKIIKN